MKVNSVGNADKQAYSKNATNAQENNMRRREEGIGLTSYNIESHVSYDDEDVFIFSGSSTPKERVNEIIKKANKQKLHQYNSFLYKLR